MKSTCFCLILSALRWRIIRASDVVAVVNTMPELFSELAASIASSGLEDHVRSQPHLTLFAFTNDAFENLSSNLQANFQQPDFTEHIHRIVSGHVVESGSFHASNIPDGGTLTAINDAVLIFSKAADGVITVNDQEATITTSDMEASNGIIHTIDGVLLPAWARSNMVQAGSTMANLSKLFSLVRLAELETEFSGPGPFTLFASDNAAFESMETDPYAVAAFGDKDYVANYLRYQLVVGVFLLSDLELGLEVLSTLGPTHTMTMPDGVPSITNIKVGQGDVFSNNGVMHMLNDGKLLMPPSLIDVVISNAASFSIFLNTISDADLLSYFRFTPRMTLFAPSNEALSQLPSGTLAALAESPFQLHLKDFILNHVIENKVIDIESMDVESDETTANGATLTILKTQTGNVQVRGDDSSFPQTVNTPGLVAYNPAIMYEIDGMLAPSWMSKNIIDVVDESGRFHQFMQLLEQTGLDEMLYTTGASLFDSTHSFTLFAPTDSVFTRMQEDRPGLYHELTHNNTFAKLVLEDHIVQGVVTSDQLLAGGDSGIPAISGTRLSIDFSHGNPILTDGNIGAADILASNGIVHSIQDILLTMEFTETPSQSPTPKPTSSPTSSSSTRLTNIEKSSSTLSPTQDAGSTNTPRAQKSSAISRTCSALSLPICIVSLVVALW